jgi:hypothetical protein
MNGGGGEVPQMGSPSPGMGGRAGGGLQHAEAQSPRGGFGGVASDAPASVPTPSDSGDPGLAPSTGSLGLGGYVAGRAEKAKKTDAAKSPAPEKQPQIWRREGRRPAFARVYVGGGNSLELVSLQVTVTVEGPRARTLVDHIFRNPHDRQLEGTFEYPLPTGASPSYYAMFIGQTRQSPPPRFARRAEVGPLPENVLTKATPADIAKRVDVTDWGRLQEGRVVGKEKALETYEEIVRGRIDPALLEYAGGNTFSGRVFPIPPQGFNRVIIAYEELLPAFQDHVAYRFPLPDCKLSELQFTLTADSAECLKPAFEPRDAQKTEGGSQLVFTRTWKEQGPGGAAQFTFQPLQPELQMTSGKQGESGPLYLYARIRPDLKTQAAQPFAQHAVFLLDTSQSEHPDRFDVSMKLLRKILESDPAIKQFNVLTFDVAATWLQPGRWLANTSANRDKVFSRLDGLVLEGATDFSAALNQLVEPGFEIPSSTPVNVFLLSDGHVTWGESEVAPLVARFESRCPFATRFYCYRTGLGAENDELFEALIRRGGAVFNCFAEDDLPAAARAHQSECLQIEHVSLVGGPTASDLLVAGRKAAVYPDGELVVATRVSGTGRARLVIEGVFQGQKIVQEYPLEITGAGELAPRGWAEVAVASLLTLNDPELDPLIVAHCQEFGIACRLASFLVLENEADYKRLNLQAERGSTVPGGDLGRFVESAWAQLGQVTTAKSSFERFLRRLGPRAHFLRGRADASFRQLLALLTEADFELPESSIRGRLLEKTEVAPAYLLERERDPRNVATYLAEAKRRMAAKDSDGAVRALSSIVEEYPARSDALRLVGYRLIDLKQPAAAARLFDQVQRQRPFEPHSYRDLARSLEECGKFGLAALQYEILMAGSWHTRFHQSIKTVALEEYARMMREALRRKDVSASLKNHFGQRLARMNGAQSPSDLRVTISWNTDGTDVDLWVIEPDGTKCFYQHRQTQNGGQLSQDETQGYGPERYQIPHARPGIYTVLVHYFRANPNLLTGESHVQVAVTRKAGTPQETSERRTVILKRQDEQVEVCKVKF